MMTRSFLLLVAALGAVTNGLPEQPGCERVRSSYKDAGCCGGSTGTVKVCPQGLTGDNCDDASCQQVRDRFSDTWRCCNSGGYTPLAEVLVGMTAPNKGDVTFLDKAFTLTVDMTKFYQKDFGGFMPMPASHDYTDTLASYAHTYSLPPYQNDTWAILNPEPKPNELVLPYIDYRHYAIEMVEDLNWVWFDKRAEPTDNNNISWRLNFYDTPGDINTARATLLYGHVNDGVFVIDPIHEHKSYMWPVRGDRATPLRRVGLALSRFTQFEMARQ